MIITGALPQSGRVITFKRTPTASWASVDTAYIATYDHRHIHLRNVKTGGATSDPKWAWSKAAWEYAQ